MMRVGTDRLGAIVAEQLRILAVAGITVGVIVVGLGSRLAMFALRLTSPDAVIGLQSDDDFTIGRMTLSGTYNLLVLGAGVGIIGVAAYQCVAPRLIGPNWFRRLTVAVASGAVVGSMLIHDDGVDFRALKPTWFAIALFVLLPALFGAAIGTVVDRVSRPTSRTATGRARWVLPVGLGAPVSARSGRARRRRTGLHGVGPARRLRGSATPRRWSCRRLCRAGVLAGDCRVRPGGPRRRHPSIVMTATTSSRLRRCMMEAHVRTHGEVTERYGPGCSARPAV